MRFDRFVGWDREGCRLFGVSLRFTVINYKINLNLSLQTLTLSFDRYTQLRSLHITSKPLNQLARGKKQKRASGYSSQK